MDNLNAPVVKTQPSVVPIFSRVSLSALLSVTDADLESTVTRYRYRDNSNGAGRFLFGEQAQVSNQWHEASAAQVNSISYKGGSGFATESFSVQVYDGKFWSNIATNNITTGNVSPVINAVPARLSASDLVRIDRFFTVSDGDNDPILSYMFVDRNNNAGGGRFVGRPQARWFSIAPGDLSTLLYQGADTGTETELVAVKAWDGYSFSDTVEFAVTTTTEPEVLPTSETILVDQRRSAVAFFNTQDADNDNIFSYNFNDYRTNSDGGYWELDGVRMPSATWFNVLASDLGKLFYVGASTGPQEELVGVQVYDGFQFSNVENFVIQTVTAPIVSGRDTEIQRGHFINMATGQTKNSIDGVLSETGIPVLDFMDADGDAISKFMFNDLAGNSNGGNFVFKGTQIASSQFFLVDAAELDQLYYRGGEFGPQGENVRVLVEANGVWSDIATFRVNTLQNIHAPEVSMFDVTAAAGVVMNLSGLFSVTDGDFDAFETFSFYDTGDDVNSGFFSVNGVAQPAQNWITLDWEELGTVRYHLSDLSNVENVRLRVSDGRKISTIESSTITSVAKPIIDATVNDISLDTIERVPASSLITKLDDGPSFSQYQVYDENTFFRSGRLELDGVDLQQGVVHTLTASQFNRMVFKGAESDFGRELDPMLVRGDNGVTGWTEWERINVNTDPVGGASLTSGTQWFDANPDKTVITYTFVDGNGTNEEGPSHDPVPQYYVCVPFAEPDEECNAVNEAIPLNQPQRETVREVLGYFQSVAAVEFVEVPYTANADEAVFTFGATNLPDGVGAWAYLPSGQVQSGTGAKPGDVWFDTDSFNPNTNFTVGPGSNFQFTAAHEIGHALGFKHPFEIPNPLSIFLDFDYNTVMSYTHDSVHNPEGPGYPEQPSTGMLYDVVELQRLYGVNPTHNDNNNHYGNFFSGSYPHFTGNDEQHQTTLWDTGGIDTFNFSNHEDAETIDLREGAWTSVNGVQQTLRIAYGAVIENARGGPLNDNIRGNEIPNLLFGNAGDDILRGGGDNDVLRGGSGDDTYIWSLGDGRDRIREEANGGIDVVEFYDPSGAIDSLEDDFTVRKLGNELRIDLTLDQGEGQGTVSIVGFDNPESSVELMRIHGLLGAQIGEQIDLLSLYEIATSTPTQYRVTDQVGQNMGFIAAPLT